MKKVAIFHDYFGVIGGGEKLVVNLARGLGADVITTDADRQVLHNMGADDVKVIEIGRNPARPPLKQISATKLFSLADFSGKYDYFILSGNWARYAAFNHHPNLYYCHTPTRVFYDLKETTANRLEGASRGLFYSWARMHGWFDIHTLKHIDKIVVNSRNVQERVRKYYGRESEVVYTAVRTKDFRFDEVGDFWLSVNRLYPEKRIGMQLDIFRSLPGEKLKIVGEHGKGDYSEGYFKGLKAPPNVEFLGAVDDKTLINLYATCRGLITTAYDEDLGLTPIEAMASGKAVLATDEGGYRETVVDGKTGWLLPAEPDAFVQKIKSVNQDTLAGMREECRKRAMMFDESAFTEKISSMMEHAWGA